jgi:hypothetical protein
MDFGDIFNSDGSGGLPDWVQQGVDIYTQIAGGGEQQGPPTSAPIQGPQVASFGGPALWVIGALVLAALVFGVKGRG